MANVSEAQIRVLKISNFVDELNRLHISMEKQEPLAVYSGETSTEDIIKDLEKKNRKTKSEKDRFYLAKYTGTKYNGSLGVIAYYDPAEDEESDPEMKKGYFLFEPMDDERFICNIYCAGFVPENRMIHEVIKEE